MASFVILKPPKFEKKKKKASFVLNWFQNSYGGKPKPEQYEVIYWFHLIPFSVICWRNINALYLI